TYHVSSHDFFFYKHCLREKYPLPHSHTVFISLVFGSTHICEQLLSRVKYRKSKISTKALAEHLENSLRMAATAIKPD
ncbi:hypothetical protein, partial [Escherichia coli]|uniref:hypothetical protein n=1 Tax=Escherichia coli TaxID=562 RepID=UPI0032DB033B